MLSTGVGSLGTNGAVSGALIRDQMRCGFWSGQKSCVGDGAGYWMARPSLSVPGVCQASDSSHYCLYFDASDRRLIGSNRVIREGLEFDGHWSAVSAVGLRSRFADNG